MNKKIMLLALAAVSAAVFALPATASANSAHISNPENFTVASAVLGHLTTAGGQSVTCTSTSGSGSFENSTTGSVNLVFHGCKESSFGFSCNTAGQPSGTITASNLTFHLISFPGNNTNAGILVTPPTNATIETSNPTRRLFASFSCFGVGIKVIGNGIIGTITAPHCGVASKTATMSFTSKVAGTQDHLTWTGVTYDLQRSQSGGAHVTASMDAHATITFPNSHTITCTP